MGLETGSFVNDLNETNPVTSDPGGQGDDHLRLIKGVLKNTFPNASKAFRLPVVKSITSSTVLVATDENSWILTSAATGAVTLTLPTLAAGAAGWRILVQKTEGSVNSVVISPASGTINGGSSVSTTKAFDVILVVWSGTTWFASPAFPAAVPDASSTVKGIVELATDAEAIAGADTVRALTSANLAAVIADQAGVATGLATLDALARLTAAQLPVGAMVGLPSFTQTGAVATGAGLIPWDDSIPQITEGVEFMSLVHTPKDSANLLRIEVMGYFHPSTTLGRPITMALFKAGTADAIAVAANRFWESVEEEMIPIIHWMTAGTTSPITFSVRAGLHSSGSVTFNGTSGARKYGGKLASFISVTEYRGD